MKFARGIVPAATALVTLGLAAGPMNGVALAESAQPAPHIARGNSDLTARPPAAAVSRPGAPRPGERPSTATTDRPTAHPDGLQPIVNERGHISRSIAASTSDDTSGAPLTVNKPPGATTRAAYM